MRTATGCLLAAGLCLLVFLVWPCAPDTSRAEAYKAFDLLEKQVEAGEYPPELDRLDPAKVVMVQYLPNSREGYAEVGNDPSKWWGTVGDPQTPYQFAHGGAWPPGMYSRLRQWSPGYNTTTNWSWAFRPGLKYKKWPRARWVSHNDQLYYYIHNQQFF